MSKSWTWNQERAAVLLWLRERAAGLDAESACADRWADAIEKGEHLRGLGELPVETNSLRSQRAAVEAERDRLRDEVKRLAKTISEQVYDRVTDLEMRFNAHRQSWEAERDALKARAEAAEKAACHHCVKDDGYCDDFCAACQHETALSKQVEMDVEARTRSRIAALEKQNETLVGAIKRLERGCHCDYDYRCGPCQAVLDAHAALKENPTKETE